MYYYIKIVSSILLSWLASFLSPSPKNKKNLSEKNSLYFEKWNFLDLILKNFLYFGQQKPEKNSLYFRTQKTENLKSLLYFEKCKFSAQAQKIKKSTPRKFLIVQETETPLPPQKKFLCFRKRNFLIFLRKQKPQKVLIFQEVT